MGTTSAGQIINTCHAGDPGSIPGGDANLLSAALEHWFQDRHLSLTLTVNNLKIHQVIYLYELFLISYT